MNDMIMKVAAAVDTLRQRNPLTHLITNYVTVNDVANALLAIGASPIMADDIGEAADIASLSAALVLNIGTLNQRTIDSMLAAGRCANELGVPVVFDPVGAGASRLRNETVQTILNEVKVAIIRGNLSEISFAAGLGASTKGVDSAKADEKNDAAAVARTVAKKYGCISAVTGAVDAISDGARTVRIENGHPMLSRVTGTGCVASALTGAFAGAGGDMLVSAVGGIAAMGIAGEMAFDAAGKIGAGAFHVAIIDALSRLDGKTILERAKIYEA